MADDHPCPVCRFRGTSYDVQLHFEEIHVVDSPFVAREDRPRSTPLPSNSSSRSSNTRSIPPEELFAVCNRPGCGQEFLLSEIEEHLYFHTALDLAEEEASNAPPLPPRPISRPVSPTSQASFQFESTRDRASPRGRHASRSSSGSEEHLRQYQAGRPGRVVPPNRYLRPPRVHSRLGSKEVGPYFSEESMPTEVQDALVNGGLPRRIEFRGRDGRLRRETIYRNQTDGIIFVLGDVCAMDRTTTKTYLCHHAVRHVYKIQCAGQFCGYWAIQTVLTCLQYMDPAGPQWIPNVLQIQRAIEAAWDQDICIGGRIELGSICGTRKWIGSNESFAFFQYTGWNPTYWAFQSDPGPGGETAAKKLLDYVEAYFISGEDEAYRNRTSLETKLPPIYLQRPGHALVIVGLEKKSNGTRNLLVFDSSYEASTNMQHLAAGRPIHASIRKLLGVYRRPEERLNDEPSFEVIVPWPADDLPKD